MNFSYLLISWFKNTFHFVLILTVECLLIIPTVDTTDPLFTLSKQDPRLVIFTFIVLSGNNYLLITCLDHHNTIILNSINK